MAGVSLIAFVIVERTVAAPMLDLRLFGDRNFTGSAIASLCLFAAVIGSIAYLALYQLTIQKYSPLEVGLQATTFGVTAALGSVAARRLTGRLPDRAVVATGLLLVAAGMMLFYGLEIDSGWRALLPGYLLVGFGFGLVQPSLVSAALSAAGPGQSGMVSGASNTFRQLGAPAGIAALGVVLQTKISEVAGRLLAAMPVAPQDSARLVELIGSGQTQAAVQSAPDEVRPGVGQAAAQAFVDALNVTLLWAAGVAALGAVLALAVMATPARSGTATPSADEEPAELVLSTN